MIVLEVGKELDQIHVGDGRVQPSNKIKVRNIEKYFLSQPDLLSHLLLLVALEEERLGHDLARHDLPRDDVLQLVALGEASLAQEPSSLVLPKQKISLELYPAFSWETSYLLVVGSVNMSGISTALLASVEPAGCLALIFVTLH